MPIEYAILPATSFMMPDGAVEGMSDWDRMSFNSRYPHYLTEKGKVFVADENHGEMNNMPDPEAPGELPDWLEAAHGWVNPPRNRRYGFSCK